MPETTQDNFPPQVGPVKNHVYPALGSKGGGNGHLNGHAKDLMANLSKKGFDWPRLFGSGHPYENIIWDMHMGIRPCYKRLAINRIIGKRRVRSYRSNKSKSLKIFKNK